MIIGIRENSEMPIYMQIRDQIVMGISAGELGAGEQLPTVRALAEEIGVNTMTVSKAYQLLKNEGYIQTDRRKGARISRDFASARELSAESRNLLDRIAAEAKLGGISETEFVELCRKAYGGNEG